MPNIRLALSVVTPVTAAVPEIAASPVTVKADVGAVLLIPTLLLTPSTNNVPLSKLTFADADSVPVIVVLPAASVLLIATAPAKVSPLLLTASVIVTEPYVIISTTAPDVAPIVNTTVSPSDAVKSVPATNLTPL